MESGDRESGETASGMEKEVLVGVCVCVCVRHSVQHSYVFHVTFVGPDKLTERLSVRHNFLWETTDGTRKHHLVN